MAYVEFRNPPDMAKEIGEYYDVNSGGVLRQKSLWNIVPEALYGPLYDDLKVMPKMPKFWG